MAQNVRSPQLVVKDCLKGPNLSQDLANREVIVCAGSIDTPKLLLLSGIGPSEELAKHSIQPTAVVPGIGHNLGDHCMASLRANLARDTIPLLSMTDMRAAKAQWEADQTGPLLDESAMIALGYFQVDNIQSFPELQALDEQTREHLTRPQTAHFELSITILPIPDAPKPVLITTIILLNAMSRGMVTLRSSAELLAARIRLEGPD